MRAEACPVILVADDRARGRDAGGGADPLQRAGDKQPGDRRSKDRKQAAGEVDREKPERDGFAPIGVRQRSADDLREGEAQEV